MKCGVNYDTQILKLSLKSFKAQTVLSQAGHEYVNFWPLADLSVCCLKRTKRNAMRLTEILYAHFSLKSFVERLTFAVVGI